MLVESQSLSNLSILYRRRPGTSATTILLNVKSCIISQTGSSVIVGKKTWLLTSHFFLWSLHLGATKISWTLFLYHWSHYFQLFFFSGHSKRFHRLLECLLEKHHLHLFHKLLSKSSLLRWLVLQWLQWNLNPQTPSL